jgi:hypothetical protein
LELAASARFERLEHQILRLFEQSRRERWQFIDALAGELFLQDRVEGVGTLELRVPEQARDLRADPFHRQPAQWTGLR